MPPTPEDLRELYADFERLKRPDWVTWKKSYLAYVTEVSKASREQWNDPAFQQWLWENDGVTPVGNGASVVLEDPAYSDETLRDRLWTLRELSEDLPSDIRKRATLLPVSYTHLSQQYDIGAECESMSPRGLASC